MITTPDLQFEYPLWHSGQSCVAGLDEAGRGAWAGPVSAGAVVLPVDLEIQKHLSGVRDSKQMTPRQREHWSAEVKDFALAWQVGFSSQEEIDAIGIVPATRLAMLRALAGLTVHPQHLLIDALLLREVELPQTALVKGDSRSLSIAAASVLAKVARDTLMIEMEGAYPGYGFARHKGYGTRIHRAALDRLGPCQLHRRSFRPILERLGSCS